LRIPFTTEVGISEEKETRINKAIDEDEARELRGGGGAEKVIRPPL